MISQSTIDQVFDLPLDVVIGRWVELKKKGAGFVGKSPFGEEKTPSFWVMPAKGLWKDFHSGKGGKSAVKFLMERDGIEFLEALKIVAQENGISIEYDDTERSQEYIKQKEKIERSQEVLIKVAQFFEDQLGEVPEGERRTSPQVAVDFGLGYAPKGWDNLVKWAKQVGISLSTLELMGVVKLSKKENFIDVFRDRLVMPVMDRQGKIRGFSGRDLSGDSEAPKYLNTKETKLFKKGELLFGLYQARKAIGERGFVRVVEGNFDVTSLHQAGIKNTVAPCGTSLTAEQIKILSRLTDHITLIFDGDSGGLKAVSRAIPMIVQAGMTCSVCLLDEGQDPDSLLRDPDSWGADKGPEDLFNDDVDAIEWICQTWLESAKTVPAKSKAQDQVADLLSRIQNDSLRTNYIDRVVSITKLKKRELTRDVSTHFIEREEESGGGLRLPPGVDPEEVQEFGFYGMEKKGKTGYYFQRAKHCERGSNFIIRPIFHIYDVDDNKRLIQINNGWTKKIVAVASDKFITKNEFRKVVAAEGNFIFDGSESDFNRVVAKAFGEFPLCHEIKTLGQQREGFFAWANGIVEAGVFHPIDPNGIVESGDSKFFLPVFSDVFSQVRHEGGDPFENERNFVHHKTDLNFKQWGEKMIRVHQDNGILLVAYAVSVLFRDYIFEVLKVFPHLFLFGQVETGKSYGARSLHALWFGNTPTLNLNNTTVVGLTRKVARTRNAVAWVDEYEDDRLDPRVFQFLKAAYDGIGRETGIKSVDNRTKNTEVNSGLVISGQYLPNRDDNALLTRSLLLKFTRKAGDLSQEDVSEGELLKGWERNGISGILDPILGFRDLIKTEFSGVHHDVHEQMKADLKEAGYSGRVMFNFSAIMAVVKILEKKIEFPFTFSDFKDKCLEWIVDQSSMVQGSDSIASFWKMLEYLVEQNLINRGEDFLIEKRFDVEVYVTKREASKILKFPNGEELLFLRLTNIHPLYMEAHRKQTGQTGVKEQSLRHYFQASKAYIGTVKNVTFDNTRTSAVVFSHQALKKSGAVDLDRGAKRGKGSSMSQIPEPVPGMNGDENQMKIGDGEDVTF